MKIIGTTISGSSNRPNPEETRGLSAGYGRKTKIGIIALLCIIAAFYFASITAEPDLKPDINPDSSTYLVLARSLASGRGYTNIDLVCNPHHNQFPFIFPALLVPFVYFSGFNVLILKGFVTILALCCFLCLAALFVKYRTRYAVPVVLLTAVSPWIFRFSHSIMAEIPYLLFSLLAVFFAFSYKNKKNILNLHGFLTVFFLALACFTRSIGISLVAGIACGLLFDPGREPTRFKKALFIVAGFGILAITISFIINGSSSSGGYTYLDYLLIDPYNGGSSQINTSILFSRLAHNCYALVFYGFPNILAGIHFKGRNALSIVMTGFVAWGFIAAFKKNRCVIEWYMAFYLLILLIWPWTRNHGTRFLIPTVPFVFYYFLSGAIAIKGILPSIKPGAILYATIFALLFAFNSLHTYRFIVTDCGKDWAGKPSGKYIKMADFINERSPADATFISSNSSALFVWGRRRSPCVDLTTADGQNTAIKNNRGSYLILDPVIDPESFQDAVKLNPEWFSEWYNKDGLKIYKIR